MAQQIFLVILLSAVHMPPTLKPFFTPPLLPLEPTLLPPLPSPQQHHKYPLDTSPAPSAHCPLGSLWFCLAIMALLPCEEMVVEEELVAVVKAVAEEDVKDLRIRAIASSIRVVPDFPKPGIMFQDITTLLLDPKAFKDTVDLFVERYSDRNISVVAGVEARGFIFGPPIALAIGAKFIPLRKPKKLPGHVISEEYVLEYGSDRLEMHVGAVQPGERALVVDDLIATGGTLCAAMKLLDRAGAEVVECACVIEIPELKGRERLYGKPLYVLVESQ